MIDPGWRVENIEGLVPWLEAARDAAHAALKNPVPAQLRQGGTWYVGLDALPNDPDGTLGGIALPIADLPPLHPAQLSVVWPGYPQQDADESDAAHRFRRNRDAAHVDGLHPIGPDKRRMLREAHAFILGVPLANAEEGASPLVVYEGSHLKIGKALSDKLAQSAQADWPEVDLTQTYVAARKLAFADCPRRLITAKPGQVIWLHRHLLHGIAPWTAPDGPPRMIAYFRPECADWSHWIVE